MAKEHKGPMLKPKKKNGKLLKKEHKGDLIKREGVKGNPLWKETKLNEDKKNKKLITE